MYREKFDKVEFQKICKKQCKKTVSKDSRGSNTAAIVSGSVLCCKKMISSTDG